MIERCAIIGAGISGLSAAYFLQKRIPGVSIDIYDAQKRAGGVIRSENVSGCIVEGGPDSFLTMKRAASKLCEEIGLGAELVGSNDAYRRTYIFQDRELKELPDGFFMMVPTKIAPLAKTDLFTWQGKLEALSDLFSYPEETDCTVSDFLQRRFGKEVLDKIAEPMISGIYGADVQRLSLQSALPQIWEMQKKGSIILQLLKRKPTTPSAESLFTTLKDGMQSIVQHLQQNIAASYNFERPVKAIEKRDNRWSIQDSIYDAVIVAGSKLPKIETPSFEKMESIYKTIRRNSAIVFVAGFRGVQKEGFGWLVPAQERHSILACTYVTNKFPNRSPSDLFLVRTFMGGDHAARWIDRPDDAIYDEVLKELSRIGGIHATPEFHRIFRWFDAMPEYHVGHRNRIETIQNVLRLNHGLYFTGNIFSGVGIPDCIQHAEHVVAELVNSM